MRLPNTPQLTALGGINTSVRSADVGLALNNPALLSNKMHSQLNAVFNSFYAGIKTYHLSLAYHQQNLQTNFALGLNYFDYGNVTETDAAGNIRGVLRPVDWALQLAASRRYLQNWTYGISTKFISSSYGVYRSHAIAMDAGILYADSAGLFSVSMLVKNMGTQLKKYSNTRAEDLPFDLQAGITKKLKNAPLSFSFTAQRLHQFHIRYSDTLWATASVVRTHSDNFLNNLFRHFVFATQVYPIPQIEFTIGYNHLRRQELNIGNTQNGMNGFSLGVGLLVKKLQIRYARSYFQNNTAYTQLGLTLQLNEYFGLGRWGQKIGW